MIERHWDGIAAYCQPENKVALGFVEGLNNKIRVIQRRAYGLRDEEYLRLKILTCMLPQSSEIARNSPTQIPEDPLNLGVIDELGIALAPVLFGGGRRLFENLREQVPQFRIEKVVDSSAATHLRYVRE